jgi:hypothetical protein
MTLTEQLTHIGIRGLGFDPDEPNHKIVWDGDDILWMNQYGSYTRRVAREHQTDTAFCLLRFIRDEMNKRQWDMDNPDDLKIAVQAYNAATRDMLTQKAD